MRGLPCGFSSQVIGYIFQFIFKTQQMPIAHCIITSDCHAGSDDLVESWARESGQPSEHMTINVISSTRQYGNRYAVMATLWLPSIWSSSDISSLQLGLARALTNHFSLDSGEVHVITRIVNSGMVIEQGEEAQW